MIAKKKKAVPVPPMARPSTALAGPYIGSRHYQILSSVEGIPPHHPIKRLEAVKGKTWLRVIQFGLPRLPRRYGISYWG